MKIINVIKNSPAEKAGIKAGSRLVSIDEHEIHDRLDYMFYGDDFGLEFESYLMDEQKNCANKCIFCFIDQLPPNMRRTLYFKDDDSRLSFLLGNYISLTNLTERDVARIIKMKLSVNVSVHTTDKALRVKMLGNPRAGEVLKYLYEMARAGVELNCQVVICPEVNDGAHLHGTLKTLTGLKVNSIACVPVGITKYRKNLKAFDKQSAISALEIIESFRCAYASDELYLLAERELPPYEHYGFFPQYENGVGMLRLLEHEYVGARIARPKSTRTRKKSIATGVSAAPFIKQLVGENAQVYAIKNDFFGHSVTVAGLVTGQDLIAQLRGKDLGEELLIPETMLRADEDVFLDDITVGDVQNALGVKIRAVAVNGEELRRALWL
jgi:putative radical SAM enzyme (TIGR03279 family)